MSTKDEKQNRQETHGQESEKEAVALFKKLPPSKRLLIISLLKSLSLPKE